jgi:hypothetical protein
MKANVGLKDDGLTAENLQYIESGCRLFLRDHQDIMRQARQVLAAKRAGNPKLASDLCRKIVDTYISERRFSAAADENRIATATDEAGNDSEWENDLARMWDFDEKSGRTTVAHQRGLPRVQVRDRDGHWISQRSLPTGDDQLDYAATFDRETGETTRSEKNADGSRTISVRDSAGNVLRERKVDAGDKDHPVLPSASSLDRSTGMTTTSWKNPDGTITITRTDNNGTILSSKTRSAASIRSE